MSLAPNCLLLALLVAGVVQAGQPEGGARVAELRRAADRAVAARKFAEAERNLAELARLRPQDARVHFRLGMVRAELRRFAGAAEAFDRALALDPASGETRFNLALAYHRAGAHARALETYRNVPEAKLAAEELRLLGGALVELDQYARGAAYLTRSCNRKEDAGCLYDLTIALLKGKEDQRAVRCSNALAAGFREMPICCSRRPSRPM
jgi:tetratricopeptide (TPR) repeat protein